LNKAAGHKKVKIYRHCVAHRPVETPHEYQDILNKIKHNPP
jgi:hypothetical protein